MELRIILLVLFYLQIIQGQDYYDNDYFDNQDKITTPAPTLSKAELKKCDAKCVFHATLITSKNIGSFPKCAKVCAVLLIDGSSDLTEKQLTVAFKNMKNLIGALKITNTNYTSAGFLGGLRKIEAATLGVEILKNNKMLQLGWKNLTTIAANHFYVNDNAKMQKLNLPKWTTLKCTAKKWCWSSVYPTINCLAANELKTFVINNIKNVRKTDVRGTVCPLKTPTKKQCSKPTVGCQELVGDLVIGPKFDTKTVESLKILYGSLIINNSSLTDFKCFGNLTYIIQPDETRIVIDVQNNKHLTTVRMPKLKRIFSIAMPRIIFQNNTDELLTDYQSCRKYLTAMGEDEDSHGSVYQFGDNYSCKQMEKFALKWTTKKATTKKSTTKK